jgi:hypothetical protein
MTHLLCKVDPTQTPLALPMPTTPTTVNAYDDANDITNDNTNYDVHDDADYSGAQALRRRWRRPCQWRKQGKSTPIRSPTDCK